MTKLILLAISFLISVPALAGKEGGSGGAYVCEDHWPVGPDSKPGSGTKITSVEFVDLWELRELRGQTIAYDDVASVEDQVMNAIERLRRFNPVVASQLLKMSFQTIDAGPQAAWAPPKDVNSMFTKNGCPLKGLMYFDDISNQLVRNPELFPYLKRNTVIAAAYFHELFYKWMRDSNHPPSDSRYARYVTGCLFSTDPGRCFDIRPTELPREIDVWECDIAPSNQIPGRRESPIPYYNFSFYIFNLNGSMTPQSNNLDSDNVRVVLKSVGPLDFTNQTVELKSYLAGPGFVYSSSYPERTITVSLSTARAIGGNLQLGNPLTTYNDSLVLYASKYAPLTLSRYDTPKHSSICKLVPKTAERSDFHLEK